MTVKQNIAVRFWLTPFFCRDRSRLVEGGRGQGRDRMLSGKAVAAQALTDRPVKTGRSFVTSLMHIQSYVLGYMMIIMLEKLQHIDYHDVYRINVDSIWCHK